MIHGSNANPSDASAGTLFGWSPDSIGSVAMTELDALASGKVGGRRNRSLLAGSGRDVAGWLVVGDAAGRASRGTGAGTGVTGWAAGGRTAGTCTLGGAAL